MISVVFDFLGLFVIWKMSYILNNFLLWKMNWFDYIKNKELFYELYYFKIDNFL